MTDLMDYFKSQQPAMIDLLTALVNHETPTGDKAHVDALCSFIETKFAELGAASIERMPQTDCGDFLFGQWNADAPGKPIMFIGHMDTVLPVGTLAQRPVRIDDDGRLYGPGAVDMKGGLTTAMTVIRGLQERGEFPNRPVWYFLNSEEETGSVYSTPVIQALAKDCALVIVLEPGTTDGAIKVRRKGIATYRVHVNGRAAHAGNEPEEGINAIVELARQIGEINKLNDLRNGTSVSVTLIEGGTAGNVIPDKASAYLDTRVLTMVEMERVQAALSKRDSMMPGATVEVEQIRTRAPMEYNDLMKATEAQCQEIGKRYGVTVRGESVGGGSDGNTTASMGIPTLDGMGPYGGGLHAVHEHVLVSSMPERATLIAGLLKDWPSVC